MVTQASIAANPRKKPLQARSQLTVSSILQATAHILETVGYDGLTTNAVAIRAGVSIGSLYQYFPSKEALVGELVDRDCDRMNALFAEAFLAAQALPPRALARALISAVYRAKCDNPALSRVLREQIPRTGRLGRFEETQRMIIETCAAYLEKHQGELRISSPSRAAFLAVELADALTLASVVKGQDTPEEAINEITDIVTRYLFP